MVFVAGLIGIVVFYIIILGVGIWASRKAKDNSEEELMLAGRNLGFVVGTLTLIATWVGGGYINGASEVMFTSGLIWAQVPIGYSISLFAGAVLFVKPMRDLNCVTLLDPFQRKYGNNVGAFLFIPSIFGDLFWIGSILNALGSALTVITDLSPVASVIISVLFVACYTSLGAMYSVTYTDVVQMFFILFGLLLSLPFVATNEHLREEDLEHEDWIGNIPAMDAGEWTDIMLLLIFGGIPWQGYMQRILAIKKTKTAQYLSMISVLGCAAMSIPSCFIGGVARVVDWEAVDTFSRNITKEDASNILPLVLRHLTPAYVAFFGLGSISAAVMSSADSSVLSFSAMFSRNLYKNLFRKKASKKEMVWVLRITVFCISTLAAVIALTVSSIYYLSVLSSDLIYVVLFPQLLLVIHWTRFVNTYGCVSSFVVGTTLRILSGEQALGLPPVIKYPYFDYVNKKQKFPHRTLAMLCALLTHIVVSLITRDPKDTLSMLALTRGSRSSREGKPKEGETSQKEAKEAKEADKEALPETKGTVDEPKPEPRQEPRPEPRPEPGPEPRPAAPRPAAPTPAAPRPEPRP